MECPVEVEPEVEGNMYASCHCQVSEPEHGNRATLALDTLDGWLGRVGGGDE